MVLGRISALGQNIMEAEACGRGDILISLWTGSREKTIQAPDPVPKDMFLPTYFL